MKKLFIMFMRSCENLVVCFLLFFLSFFSISYHCSSKRVRLDGVNLGKMRVFLALLLRGGLFIFFFSPAFSIFGLCFFPSSVF